MDIDTFEQWLIPGLWILWALYWTASAIGTKRTVRHESVLSRIAHLGPLLVAGWLLWMRASPWPWLTARPPWAGEASFQAGAALTAAGLLFTVWARVHLGRNWSGTVTVKQDHELVRTGPYRWVRHPIYTGLLLAFAGSGLAAADGAGVLAFVLVWLSLWRKWRLEERWMRETFGDSYDRYRHDVPAVVPSPWRHA